MRKINISDPFPTAQVKRAVYQMVEQANEDTSTCSVRAHHTLPRNVALTCV